MKGRGISNEEKALIKIITKHKKQADVKLARMKQLSYTQDKINDVGGIFYKEVVRKTFTKHKIDLGYTITIDEYSKLLQSPEYLYFWTRLSELDTRLHKKGLFYFENLKTDG